MKKTAQRALLMEFFKKHPNKDIPHPEIVDWVTSVYKRRTGNVFRDPDRGIRQLHQEGILIKVQKGIYRYDPDLVKKRDLEDFTEEQKKIIFERDGYKCVICGRGPKEGYDIYADHIKAKENGGKAIIENGQTLCGPHNNLKKKFKQTETGKKMFIKLYQLAKAQNDDPLKKFCEAILKVFEEYDINGHIKWEK